MMCPKCRSERHRYSGQSDHKYLDARRVGRVCLDCHHEFVIEQVVLKQEWHRPPTDQSTLDMFTDSPSKEQ